MDSDQNTWISFWIEIGISGSHIVKKKSSQIQISSQNLMNLQHFKIAWIVQFNKCLHVTNRKTFQEMSYPDQPLSSRL